MNHHGSRLADEKDPVAEARTIASLLPAIMGQLFAADDHLAVELPLAQLRVCGMLYDGPHPMSVLSRELGVSLSAMTQIADRLERVRMVKRVGQGDDRRVRCLQLTQRGKKIMQLREDGRVQRVSAVLQHLPPKSRGEVLATLQTLIRACTATREQDGHFEPHNNHSSASRALR
jgi:DNA-binding MarR family transcriptional regulator